MWWRGAHSGGSRARLKGLRSSSQGEEDEEVVGGEEAAEVGGQDLRGHVKAAPRPATPSGAAHRTKKRKLGGK